MKEGESYGSGKGRRDYRVNSTGTAGAGMGHLEEANREQELGRSLRGTGRMLPQDLWSKRA